MLLEAASLGPPPRSVRSCLGLQVQHLDLLLADLTLIRPPTLRPRGNMRFSAAVARLKIQTAALQRPTRRALPLRMFGHAGVRSART
jgi:hypothetical protein